MNVKAMIRSMSMPIRPATCGFCEVARMAMPSLVRYTISVNPPIISTEVRMMAICTPVMMAPPISKLTSGMICGNASGLRLQTSNATCCRMMEMPMAVISGASRGAPRLAPLITAIGISIILQHVALLVWSRNPLAFPQIIPLVSFDIGGAIITGVQIAIILTSVLMMGGLTLMVYLSLIHISEPTRQAEISYA